MTSPTLTTKIRFQGADEAKRAFADIESSFRASAQRMSDAGKKVGAGLTKSVSIAGTTAKATATIGARSFAIMGTAIGGVVTLIKGSISLLVSMGRLALDVSGKLAIMTTAAVVGVNAFGIKVSQSISDIGKLARAAGVPVEKFSKLAAATRLVGGSVEDLSLGLQTLSDRIIDAAKGGASENYFKQIGVSVRDAAGNIKPTEQVLSEIADGLKAVPSDTLRASAAFDIFGTSATKLLPILEDGSDGLNKYTEQAGKLGTTVSEEQSKKASELLKKSRQVREALLGVSYKVADVLLPELTKNSEKTAAYIAKNGDRIAKIVGKALREISGLSADLARAFLGDVAKIERGWVRRLVPGFKTVKDVVLDLLTVLGGGEAKRAPWLNDMAEAMRDAAHSAKALAENIIKAAGDGDGKLLSLAEAARGVKDIFASLRAELEGRTRDVKLPWVANIATTFRNVATVVGSVIGFIIENKDAITANAALISGAIAGSIQQLTGFANANKEAFAAASKAVAQGIANVIDAITDLITKGRIDSDNPLAFMNDWIDFVISTTEKAKVAILKFVDDVKGAFNFLQGFLSGFYDIIDKIAKTIGLDNGVQLGLVILILQFTGVLKIMQSVFSTLSTLLFSINGTIALAKSMLGWISAAVTAITSVPVAIGLAVAAVLAGLAYLIYSYWDEYVEVFKTIIGVISAVISAAISLVIGIFKTLISIIKNLAILVYKAVTAPLELLRAAWTATAAFFSSLVSEIAALFQSLWNGIASAARVAWEAVKAVWQPIGDFFSGVIHAVTGFFTELWDGIELRAKLAWAIVETSWKVMEGFFSVIIAAVTFAFQSLWDAVTWGPRKAWEAMTGVWDGMTDFFKGLVDAVADYFAGLWDGVATGASNAWKKVKGFFGFDEEPQTLVDKAKGIAADYSPRLATGGIIRGAGTGTSDSIRAWLSNGEGVVNARAVGHYGEGFIHALNGLLVPKTHFADGGIVGQMVPAAQGIGNLGNLNLAVDGKRVGSVFVERQSVRAVQRSLNRSASASRGPAPRWRS